MVLFSRLARGKSWRLSLSQSIISWNRRCGAEKTGIRGSQSPSRLLHSPRVHNAGWSSPVARQAHNLKVVSSNLAPATNKPLKSDDDFRGFAFGDTVLRCLGHGWGTAKSEFRSIPGAIEISVDCGLAQQ
jgi:hypothetical protein